MGILAHKTDAAPQVPLLATEQNFAAIHGRFKIVFLLPDGEGLCYYGQEANATVEEMFNGTATEVILDAQLGYLDCQRMADKQRGNYETAVLYRRRYGAWQADSWYVQGEMVMTNYIAFKKHIARYQVLINDNRLSLTKLETLTVPAA